MDLDNLKNQVSNITLYDIKAGFRKAQNAVMNYTEMEAKVREATNNEPWGCPTSIMQEIANGTFNYATLNEVMPMIYKRFTEKAAEEWRQIYKALQLLEFLIKNGSERVVDDARSHMSLLKMLRQFHYIDQNGKDQGINVRNRAKELAELLGDVERIRAERKKARATRNKYGGVEGGIGIGGSGSRYGGFGGESGSASGTFGGYSGGVYGDGGGFGGQSDDFAESQSRRSRFEEYDEYDEGTGAASSRRRTGAGTGVSRVNSAKTEPPKPKEPEVDLFDFGDDDIAAPALVSNGNQKSSFNTANDFGEMQSATAADDDFDDFQSATTTSATTASSQFAPPPTQASNMNVLAGTISPPPASNAPVNANYSAFKAPQPSPSYMQPQGLQQQQPQQQQAQAFKPSGYQAATPNYFGSISTGATPTPTSGAVTSPGPSSTAKAPAKPAASGGDPFANLMGSAKKPTNAPTKGPTMADMARQKASAGIWGTSATAATSQSQQPQGQQQQRGSSGGGGNDLLGL